MTRKVKSAAELMAQLRADPAWVAQQQTRERARMGARVEREAREQSIVDELKTVGVEVEGVWDLVNRETAPDAALPVLVKHLSLNHAPRTLEGIARALATPDAHGWWGDLLEAFQRAPSRESGSDLRWALGLALGTAARDEDLPSIRSILRDDRYGEDRLAVLHGALKPSSSLALNLKSEFGHEPVLAEAFRRAPERARLDTDAGITVGLDRKVVEELLAELEREGVISAASTPGLAAKLNALDTGARWAFNVKGDMGIIHLTAVVSDDDTIEVGFRSPPIAESKIKSAIERVL